MKEYGSTLLALRGDKGCQISRKKHYETLKWPLTKKMSNDYVWQVPAILDSNLKVRQFPEVSGLCLIAM